jgi:predicted DNA-binding transcriptional regulator AlpA
MKQNEQRHADAAPPPEQKASRRIIKTKAVIAKTGKSRVSLWREGRKPDSDFPRPLILGPNSIGWFEDEIDAWLNTRQRRVYRRGGTDAANSA